MIKLENKLKLQEVNLINNIINLEVKVNFGK